MKIHSEKSSISEVIRFQYKSNICLGRSLCQPEINPFQMACMYHSLNL